MATIKTGKIRATNSSQIKKEGMVLGRVLRSGKSPQARVRTLEACPSAHAHSEERWERGRRRAAQQVPVPSRSRVAVHAHVPVEVA